MRLPPSPQISALMPMHAMFRLLNIGARGCGIDHVAHLAFPAGMWRQPATLNCSDLDVRY